MLVTQGDFVVQHPAIFTIRPPNACFVQEGLTSRQGLAPLLKDSFNVIGVNALRPFPALEIFQRTPNILQPSLIEEIEVAVRQTGVNQAGGRVDQELKVQSLTCLFPWLGSGDCFAVHWVLLLTIIGASENRVTLFHGWYPALLTLSSHKHSCRALCRWFLLRTRGAFAAQPTPMLAPFRKTVARVALPSGCAFRIPEGLVCYFEVGVHNAPTN